MAHITAVTVDRVAPANGYTSGGTRLSFWGQGLRSLVAPGGRAVAPGQPLPGIVVKFTRHAREPSVEIEDEDNESIDSAYLRELEELVHTADGLDCGVCARPHFARLLCVSLLHCTTPHQIYYTNALAPVEGSDADMQCLSPAFPTPCSVTLNVIVDESHVLAGQHGFSFFGRPGQHTLLRAASLISDHMHRLLDWFCCRPAQLERC